MSADKGASYEFKTAVVLWREKEAGVRTKGKRAQTASLIRSIDNAQVNQMNELMSSCVCNTAATVHAP